MAQIWTFCSGIIELIRKKNLSNKKDLLLASESSLSKDWLSKEEDEAWGKFIKGDVVVIPFPFSDLSSSKRRPALVLAELKGDDIILCQITSKEVNDNYAIPLLTQEFKDGNLNQDSNIRPNRLFTADEGIVIYKVGAINNNKLGIVIEKTIEILTI